MAELRWEGTEGAVAHLNPFTAAQQVRGHKKVSARNIL